MASTDTAVAVIDQSPAAMVEYSLADYPEAQYNRLIPTDVLGMPTDFIVPIVKTITLDIERDTYSSRDLPEGHRAPNARGLARLADAAGVDFPNSQRVDDGSNPMRASAKVWASVIDATGRVRTVVGSRDYDLTQQKMTDAQRERAKSHVFENAETRARHRAERLLLGLGQSYSIAELRKPFAVVSYVPNMRHPELREAYKQALLPTVSSMYGAAAAKQLGAGNDVVDLDQVTEKDVTPPAAPAIPIDHEPEWMRGPTAAAAPKPDFAAAIRAFADETDGGALAAGEAEIEKLGEALAGIEPDAKKAGLRALWPDIRFAAFTRGQVTAILRARESIGPEAFVEAWAKLAPAAEAAA